MGAVQRRASWTGLSEDAVGRVLAALSKAGVRCYPSGEGETRGVQALNIPVKVKEGIDAMVSGTLADADARSEPWFHPLADDDKTEPSEANTGGNSAVNNLVDIGGDLLVQPDVEVLEPQADPEVAGSEVVPDPEVADTEVADPEVAGSEVVPDPEVAPEPESKPESKPEPIRDDLTVKEAVPIIGTMSSVNALKDWRRMDRRVGVQEAIKARLAELKKEA